FRLHDGGTVPDRPLRRVTAAQVISAAPWRMTRSARGQAHYPGWYWSVTTGGHVICESRLELARLLLADFGPDVVAIAAQPFLLRAPAGGRVRRHVPDFLLIHAGRTVRVVNVKPAARLADPVAAEALAWPGELFEARGWGHEIWTGADRVFLANVRFLAGYRRPGMPPGAVIEVVLEALRPGECPGALLDRLEGAWPRALVKAAALRLLWQQRVRTDLSRPLDAGSVLEVTR
ncbi:MAG: TnsA-like heteromeric transposase endonuclease subunit, partial [Streptosporangiaceae bacterium]